MRKLEPLIDRFVDDVLRLIREATVEDLRELVAFAGPTSKRKAARKPAASPERVAGPSPRRGSGLVSETRTSKPSAVSMAAPSAADITDPEALLSMATPATTSAHVVEAPRVTAAEPDGPPSSVRSVVTVAVAPVPLSGNETVARVSNAGVVIRRRRSG